MKYLSTNKCRLLIAVVISMFACHSMAVDKTYPTIERGVEVFKQRCTLCHGSQGMGEGRIPLKIKGYPDANLAVAKKAKTKDDIHKTVVYGGLLDNIDQFMPPMGDELTWTEIESVAMFVEAFRGDPEAYLPQLANTTSSENTMKVGREVYEARCVLCHGKNGQGDGRMAKIIKTPPPFNLTKSLMPVEYLKLIIADGGEPIGRSGQMPPWKDQLSEGEIDAVVDYIVSIRQ